MLTHEHELHRRRWGRNLGLGLVLAGFVALMFGLTIVKVTRQGPVEMPGKGVAAPGATP